MPKLDDGFEEMPIETASAHKLDDGFEEVPVDKQPLFSLGSHGVDPLNLAGQLAEMPTVQDAGDLGRGTAQGALFGGEDELVGALQAAGGVLSGKVDPTKDLASKYREYQQIQEQKNKASKERSPYLYGGGELAGTLAPALLTGGAGLGGTAAKTSLKTLLADKGLGAFSKEVAARAGMEGLKMMPAGGIQGTLESEGNLSSPEGTHKLLKDTGSGLVLGGALGALFKGTSDAVPAMAGVASDKLAAAGDKLLEKSPYLRQMKKAKDVGSSGLDYFNSTHQTDGIPSQAALNDRSSIAAEKLTDGILNAKNEIGKKVGESLNKATSAGVKIDIDSNIKRTANSLDNYFQRNPAINADPQANKAFFEMLNNNSETTPLELKSILDKMDDILGSLEGDHTTLANQTRKSVSQFRGDLDAKLKGAVPDYAQAAKEFHVINQKVPEAILNGKTPDKYSNLRFGNLTDRDEKLFHKNLSNLEGATRVVNRDQDAQMGMTKLINNLKELEKTNPKAIQDMGFKSAIEAEKFIKDNADEAAAYGLGSYFGDKSSASDAAKKATSGIFAAGAGAPMTLANQYGYYKQLIKKSPKNPAGLGKSLYTATDDSLRGVANTLKQSPGLVKLGEALENGLNNKDTMRRNAAVFSVMQRPDAREAIQHLFGGDEKDDQK